MRHQIQKNDGIISAGQAAECLKIPLNTLYRLTKKGVINGMRLGKKWRYRLGDIEHYRKYGSQSGVQNQELSFVSKPAEKRKHPRLNTKINANAIFLLNNVSSECEIHNISKGGLRFVALSKNDISVGDPVRLNFVLEDLDNTKMNVKGRVVYVADNIIGTRSGAGIKFRLLDEKSKQEIARYVG